MSEKKGINKRYIINSLMNQLNDKSMRVAELESVIGSMSEELKELKEPNEKK